MTRNKRTTANLIGSFFIILLNELLSAAILGGGITGLLALVGAAFAWLAGGSALIGALILGGIGVVLYIGYCVKISWNVLQNFRGTGAYLYGLVWGGYLGN